MEENYTEQKVKIEEIKQKLVGCAAKIEAIGDTERDEYPSPRLRLWSEDVKTLEDFATGLEEWLNQPLVAEAKRYLLDLKHWSEAPEKMILETIEKDWRFLSDNVAEIEEIHENVAKTESYIGIRKKVSSWVLNRIVEKDLDKARKWASSANRFCSEVRQLEQKPTESKLAQKVKSDAVKELLKVGSFDNDNEELVNEYRNLVDKSENIVKNKPGEIKEKAILKTYGAPSQIQNAVLAIGSSIDNIRKRLVDLEWVRESPDFKGYKQVWEKKRIALAGDDLDIIYRELGSAQKDIDIWKDDRKKETHNNFLKIKRMLKGLNSKGIKDDTASLDMERQRIIWNKPDLELLHQILRRTDGLRERLRKELIGTLSSEDAASIVEDPEIIDDLGEKKGWTFERFIQALEAVLRYGLVEIRAVEEK